MVPVGAGQKALCKAWEHLMNYASDKVAVMRAEQRVGRQSATRPTSPFG